MTKYHITPEGDLKVCTAETRQCKYTERTDNHIIADNLENAYKVLDNKHSYNFHFKNKLPRLKESLANGLKITKDNLAEFMPTYNQYKRSDDSQKREYLLLLATNFIASEKGLEITKYNRKSSEELFVNCVDKNGNTDFLTAEAGIRSNKIYGIDMEIFADFYVRGFNGDINLFNASTIRNIDMDSDKKVQYYIDCLIDEDQRLTTLSSGDVLKSVPFKDLKQVSVDKAQDYSAYSAFANIASQEDGLRVKEYATIVSNDKVTYMAYFESKYGLPGDFHQEITFPKDSLVMNETENDKLADFVTLITKSDKEYESVFKPELLQKSRALYEAEAQAAEEYNSYGL